MTSIEGQDLILLQMTRGRDYKFSFAREIGLLRYMNKTIYISVSSVRLQVDRKHYQ